MRGQHHPGIGAAARIAKPKLLITAVIALWLTFEPASAATPIRRHPGQVRRVVAHDLEGG